MSSLMLVRRTLKSGKTALYQAFRYKGADGREHLKHIGKSIDPSDAWFRREFLKEICGPPPVLRRKPEIPRAGGGHPGRPAALGYLRTVYSEAYEVRGSRLIDNAGVPPAPDKRIMMQFALLPPPERGLYGDAATYLEAKRRAASLMRRAARYGVSGMTRHKAMRVAASQIQTERKAPPPGN
jgi:hypothetical protein